MNLLTIITHLSTIMGLAKGVESLVEEVATTKSVPDATHVDTVLASVQDLFDSGVIQIKNVDDAAVAKAISAIRDQLKAGAQKATG